MNGISIKNIQGSNLEDVLEPGERLLWSGAPASGQRFFQVVGDERFFHIGLLVGAAVMWSSVFFIEPETRFGLKTAYMVFGVMTFLFVVTSICIVSARQFVLQNLVYFVTDNRALILRCGRNWRLGKRLYLVSCPHSATYPYRVIPSRPYPSLQVGTMFSEDQVQPFGLGLSHPGHPVLWDRVCPPITFDYVPNAQELLELVQSGD